MTAYGRAVKRSPTGTLICEITSVNRKHFDLKALIPRELTGFEPKIRSWLAPQILRGHVVLRLSIQVDPAQRVLWPEVNEAKTYLEKRRRFEEELGLKTSDDAIASWLLSLEPESKEEEVKDGEVKELIEAAFAPFDAMRKSEGEALRADLLNLIDRVDHHMNQIQGQSKGLKKKIYERLTGLAEEFKLSSSDGVFEREAALLADKGDINEEVVRFKSHLDQLKTMINGDERGIGKSLDFILQECFREVNTIASKAADLEIARDVIQIKSELERMKEQVQNVE